jgi:hypothetical protein
MIDDQRCWEAPQDVLQVGDLVSGHINLHMPTKGMHFLGHRFEPVRGRHAPGLRRDEVDADADGSLSRHLLEFRVGDVLIHDHHGTGQWAKLGDAVQGGAIVDPIR